MASASPAARAPGKTARGDFPPIL